MAIKWELIEDRNGRNRKFWGESDATELEDVRADFREMFRKLFEEQIPRFSRDSWNCLICAETVDTGGFVMELVKDFDLLQSQRGIALHFARLRDHLEGDFSSDEDFEAECASQEKQYVRVLMEAWSDVKNAPVIQSVLSHGSIPFRIINTPENQVSPVLETTLS